MASAPPQLAQYSSVGPKLVGVTDAVPETRGAGVVLIDGGHMQRLRPPGASGLTVNYEWRPREHAGPIRAPDPAPRRSNSSSPASEWLNLGLNCGGAVLAWVGVVGMSALAPVTGGASGLGAALLYGGAIAATGQCAVSAFRTSNVYTGHQSWNTSLDNNAAYVWTMRGADVVGLIGAGGALKELKVAHTALSAKGFTLAEAIRPGLSRPTRRQLTGALGLAGGRRAAAPFINRVVRQRLLDGVGGVVGLVGSASGGITKDMVVWVVGDGED